MKSGGAIAPPRMHPVKNLSPEGGYAISYPNGTVDVRRPGGAAIHVMRPARHGTRFRDARSHSQHRSNQPMKAFDLASIAVLCAAVILFSTTPTGASARAGGRAACSLLSLAQVGSVVGVPVTVSNSQQSTPTKPRVDDGSICTYSSGGSKGFTIYLSVARGLPAHLKSIKQMWDVRTPRESVSAIRGNTLVTAYILNEGLNPPGYDDVMSRKLLAAALKGV